MGEWKECKIGDVCDTQTGPFGSQLHNEDYVERGTPIVTVEHLGNKHFSTQNLPQVSDEDKKRLSKYTLFSGDVVFSRVGSVDRCSYVSESYSGWLFSGRCLRVRVKDKSELDSQFLYYHFSNEKIKTYIRNIAVGATMPSINTGLLNEVPISFPSISKQKKIADILSSLDEKIETNRKINARLEELAQAIFKSWFIDFEPFGGKMPDDWTYKSVYNFTHELEAGKRPKGGISGITNGIPSVGAESIKGIGYYDFSKTKYIPREYAETLKKGRIKDFDLLIYKDGGKPGYFIPDFSIMGLGFPFEEMYLNEHVFRLNFGKPEINIFAYFFFRTEDVMNYLNSVGGKAAIPGINQKNVEGIKILDLTTPRVNQFGVTVLPMFKMILENCKESARLASLRDVLLPKLMSGELKPE